MPGGQLLVPPGYRPDRPAPLLVFLHGAGGTAEQAIEWLRTAAAESGVVLAAPQSEGRTWDFILGSYGTDVAGIDRMLAAIFDTCAIDPARIAIGGFSDGASYALSLGLSNGALFRHVLALSPGFAAPARPQDTPRFFIAHGQRDPVLPIARCSRRLVPSLRRAGYPVQYTEFDGGHIMPPAVIDAALRWFLGGGEET